MDIILIRHGQTEDNVERIFSTKDTKHGKRQNRLKRPKPCRYSSPTSICKLLTSHGDYGDLRARREKLKG